MEQIQDDGEEVWNQYKSLVNEAIPISFDEFVDIDESVPVCETVDTDLPVENAEPMDVIVDGDDDDDEDDEPNDNSVETRNLLTRSEALLNISDLNAYFCKFDNTSESVFTALALLENSLAINSSMKQSTLDKFVITKQD